LRRRARWPSFLSPGENGLAKQLNLIFGHGERGDIDCRVSINHTCVPIDRQKLAVPGKVERSCFLFEARAFPAIDDMIGGYAERALSRIKEECCSIAIAHGSVVSADSPEQWRIE
jgi:hypothetical protein